MLGPDPAPAAPPATPADTRSRATRFDGVDEARRVYGSELIERIIASSFESDPAADRLVQTFKALPPGAGWRMLDQALGPDGGRTLRLSPALEEFLAPVIKPPQWVDLEIVERGAVTTWCAGALNQLVALTAGSLAFGYQSASLARPLAATGRLTRMAPRRLGETARWVMAATRPGGMRPGADGFKATVRLRLIHALVRDHLLEAGDWDEREWGVPISVGDTLLTGIGGFFIVPLRALEDLGVRFSRGELESLLEQWRWITYVIGVPEHYLPATLEEAEEVVEASLAIDSGPSEESPELMNALLYHGLAFERFMPAAIATLASRSHGNFTGGFVRRWMGDETADLLGVPDNSFKHLGTAVRPLVRAREAGRRRGLLGSSERLARREYAAIERIMGLARVTSRSIPAERVQAQPVLPPA